VDNWHGRFEGFATTPAALMGKLPKEVPGLRRRDKKQFHAGMPEQQRVVG
jgi:hypothetical protein